MANRSACRWGEGYRQKNILYVFFFNLKLQNFEIVGLFIPQGLMSRTHTFEKRQCDRCQHRSLVKNTPPPSLSLPVPIPPPPYPPPQRQLTRANDIGPFGSCDLPGQWRAVPGAKLLLVKMFIQIFLFYIQ